MVVFLLILIVCCLMFGGEETELGCLSLFLVGAILLFILGFFGMLFG